jgi:hypothetical protein
MDIWTGAAQPGQEKAIEGPSAVVFLDCDGVLCGSRSLLLDFEETDTTLIHDPKGRQVNPTKCYLPITASSPLQAPLEKRCLKNLRAIVRATNAKIVLTTTWRLDSEMRDFLVWALESFETESTELVPGDALGSGLVGAVIDDTPDLKAAGRGAEVMSWLADHPSVQSYVVLDDGHALSFNKELPPGHFVQTVLRCKESAELEGITGEKSAEAIRILQQVGDHSNSGGGQCRLDLRFVEDRIEGSSVATATAATASAGGTTSGTSGTSSTSTDSGCGVDDAPLHAPRVAAKAPGGHEVHPLKVAGLQGFSARPL